jgi:hypothetical protein
MSSLAEVGVLNPLFDVAILDDILDLMVLSNVTRKAGAD